MASKRRGGFRAPELRGTLGTLLRTTTGVVRDALERGAREGRARLDSARASRRRHDALADLGELVLDLIRRGEIDLAELPEARDLVRELDELDDGPDPAADATEPEPPPPSPRRRFDDRGRPARDDGDGTVASGASLRAGRPTVPDRPRSTDTASSRASTKPMRSSGRPASDEPDRRGRLERWDAAHTFPISRSELGASPERERAAAERSERGGAERPDRPDRDAERDRSDRRSPLQPRDPARKGGISFDDEDDLADYMHPDDVPPKTPPSDPDDHDA
ncbi:MAG TPA: hypothetical protein VHW23_39940 [Kofleriaceae bacterium]|nr:hypothetical protein [Kofleriaceae bacterium]